MRFHADEKMDVISKLSELYKSPTTDVEDKIIITDTINKIYAGDDYGFPKEGQAGWQSIYDWIYKY